MPPNDKRNAAGRPAAVRWLAAHWRALLAELVSTSLLVGLGCASCLRKPDASREPAPLVHPTLSFGFLVTALSVAFGAPSGAIMNPAVSLAAALTRRISPALALAYGATQVLGATLGYAALAALAPAAREPGAGMTLPADEIGSPAAALLELAMTALLVMTVCALWVSPPDPTAPVKVGMLVGGLVLVGGWLTGASFNPARSLAPAIYHNHWTHQWVYWAGPMAGALAGVGLHVLLHGTAPGTAPGTATDPGHGTAQGTDKDGEPHDELCLHERTALRDEP